MTTDEISTVQTITTNFAIGEAIELAVQAREAWSRDLVVADPATLAEASTGLQSVTKTAKRIEEARQQRKAPLLEASRRLDGTFKPVIDRLKAVEADTKAKVVRYQQAAEAARREATRAAEIAAIVERERQRAIAEEARAQGDIDRAADATFAAEMAVAPPPPAPVKASGMITTSRWHAEVDDLSLLILACANDPERYLGLLLPNMPALNKLAVAHHGAFQVPGVRMVEEKGISVR